MTERTGFKVSKNEWKSLYLIMNLTENRFTLGDLKK